VYENLKAKEGFGGREKKRIYTWWEKRLNVPSSISIYAGPAMPRMLAAGATYGNQAISVWP